MPKNFGGKKFKQKDLRQRKTQIIIKEEGQAYLKVEKMLGNGRLKGTYTTETGNVKELQCIIPGRLKRGRRNWIEANDWLLVQLADFSKDGYVLMKYHPNDVKTLIKRGEIIATKESKKSVDEVDTEENQEYNPFTFEDEEVELKTTTKKQSTTMEVPSDEDIDFDEI